MKPLFHVIILGINPNHNTSLQLSTFSLTSIGTLQIIVVQLCDSNEIERSFPTRNWVFHTTMRTVDKSYIATYTQIKSLNQ